VSETIKKLFVICDTGRVLKYTVCSNEGEQQQCAKLAFISALSL
jgi:hypothetical protein